MLVVPQTAYHFIPHNVVSLWSSIAVHSVPWATQCVVGSWVWVSTPVCRQECSQGVWVTPIVLDMYSLKKFPNVPRFCTSPLPSCLVSLSPPSHSLVCTREQVNLPCEGLWMTIPVKATKHRAACCLEQNAWLFVRDSHMTCMTGHSMTGHIMHDKRQVTSCIHRNMWF